MEILNIDKQWVCRKIDDSRQTIVPRAGESLANIPSRRVHGVCLASWILAHLEPPH